MAPLFSFRGAKDAAKFYLGLQMVRDKKHVL